MDVVPKKLYTIQRNILCTVIKCGMDILEVFENHYDLPQPVIICTRPFGWIFIIFYVVLNREIREWCIGKDVEGSGCALF
jgi:hypothetical protein